MRKRPLGFVVGFASIGMFVGCGGGTPEVVDRGASEESSLDEATVEDLYERAQEEEEVVAYSLTSRIAEVEPAFEEAYPGVDLVPNDVDSTEQIAGAVNADDAFLADAPVVPGDLVEPGLPAQYVPPRVAVPDEPDAVFPDGVG